MISNIRRLLFLCLVPFAIQGEPILPFSDQLDKSLNQQVSLRGFLYQTENQEWILASEPNIKSCCLHKKPLVYLDASFENALADHPVTIEGYLSWTPPFYYLADSKMVPEKIESKRTRSLLLLFLPCLLILFFLWRRSRRLL